MFSTLCRSLNYTTGQFKLAGFYSIARGESMDGKGFRNRAKAVLVRAIVSGQKIFRRYYYLLDLIFLK